MAELIPVGVIGVGSIGQHHARLYAANPQCDLIGVYDLDSGLALRVAERVGSRAFGDVVSLMGSVDVVSIAVPTLVHYQVASEALKAGCDVLLEKPICASLSEADQLIAIAAEVGKILQIGHVERYNPAVEAMLPYISKPGFIEVDRLGSFVPRSLEVDVIVDLMIHDLDIIHAVVASDVVEIRAVGVAVLSGEIDIANARLEFADGCIANLTASRVSLNRTRKVRIFQPRSYFSIDYSEQVVAHFELTSDTGGRPGIAARPIEVRRGEPLQHELEDFLRCVRERSVPRVDGAAGRRALETAFRIRETLRQA